jgi:MoaA/NifB/PqqE/SkfB family radical SAM enzyme
MFPFKELKQIHLEITNNCQASCPMCARNIQGGLENPLIKTNSWTIDDYKAIMTETVLKQIEGLYFCGNFGDPLLNNDLIEMCRYTTQVNPNINLRIHTNGSLRNHTWWRELAMALPKVHNVVFAIDGLSDTHKLYRVGTDYHQILRNAKDFITSGGKAEWCFIKFKHNEHQVEMAKEIASELGFSRFSVKNSSRFLLEPKIDVLDKNGNITHIIEPASEIPVKFIDRKIIESYKEIVNNSHIKCQSYDLREVYIDSYKNLFPCCWLASIPYTQVEKDGPIHPVRVEILNQYNDLVNTMGGIDNLNCIKNKVEDIIDSNMFQTVWDEYWTTKKLITCARTCGVSNVEFAKPRDQLTETNEL